jgi:ectoine hydroxylase-related dioxygenase (phytanoyl-CoA dioxygenase family)
MMTESMTSAVTFVAPDPAIDSGVFVDSCCEAFTTYGAVVINNVISPDHLDDARRAYLEEYGSLIDASREVGDKRTMVALEVKPPFNNPALFAPAAVMPVLRRLLGGNCILDAYVAVTSRPDSADQHVHVDFPFLFEEDERLSQSLPPYAITLAIPLVPLDAMTGVTRIWPGTHRHQINWKNTQPDLMDSVSVLPEPGGCYLFDARLLHGGTANYTRSERPIIYLVYCRPWWRDSTNFYHQKPLIISPEVLKALPPELQPMFCFAT